MDIEKYVRLNDEGKIEIDRDAFQSGLDAEIYKAVDKYRNGKGKDEIRKQLEEEAKQTADERLKKERDEFEAYKLSETIKLNQAKAKNRLADKGFSEKEIEIMLSHVDNDEEKSLSTIDTLIAERQKFIEETNKRAIENLQSQQQTNSNIQQLKTPDSNKPETPRQRTKQESLEYFTKRNRK